MKFLLLQIALLSVVTQAAHMYNFKHQMPTSNEGQSLMQTFTYAGTTNSGMKYYIVPKPYIDIRYLTE